MENHTDTTPEDTQPRPFGYWLRAVDRLLSRSFESAFESEGATRRDWRLLDLLSGEVVAPELSARLQRHGGKKLRGLIDRGWVARDGDAITVTEEGRAARERLNEAATGIRNRVSGAVSAEDFTTTVASLEAIARELGWDPAEPMGRGFRAGPRTRRAFGPSFRGHSFGFGPRHGFASPGADDGDFGPRGGFGPRHGDHRGECAHGRRAHGEAQRAFERGFEAGARHRDAPHRA